MLIYQIDNIWRICSVKTNLSKNIVCVIQISQNYNVQKISMPRYQMQFFEFIRLNRLCQQLLSYLRPLLNRNTGQIYYTCIRDITQEFRYYYNIQQSMTDQIEPHILQNYQIVKKIGSGAYGHVWKVIDRQTKCVKALKKNFDAFSNSTDAQRTYRQVMFLRQLKHTNIINMQKAIRARNDKDIYLLFEHMDVDLHTLIRQNGKSTNLQQRHKQYIIYQIAKSIYYLHNSKLIHRDLKPSNVLINQNCDAKLCDFGLVRLMEEPNDQELVIMTDYIATRWYRAPELLLGCKDYNYEVDIWAFGCLIGQIFNGKALFPGTSTINQIQKVVAWTGSPSSSELKQMSINLNQSLLQLLNTRKKINRAQFFGNRISASCLDLISKMLQFDPSKRISIEQVLRHPYLSQFYDQKQIKQIKNNKVNIQLHINDNTKLTLKDYRQLIYSEINNKSKVLTNVNYTSNHYQPQIHSQSSSINNSKTKVIKNDQNKNYKKVQVCKQKSKQKTVALDSGEVNTWNKSQHTVYQSTQNRQQNKLSRKQVKSSLQKSIKSKGETRKKGISLCSKSSSKNASLSKKKTNQIQTVDSRQLSNNETKKLKPVSRSCTQKYDKARKIIYQESSKNYRKVLLTDCYINENIGRKVMLMH